MHRTPAVSCVRAIDFNGWADCTGSSHDTIGRTASRFCAAAVRLTVMTRAVCVLCFVIGCASPQSDATPPSTAVKSEKVEPAKSEAAKRVEPAKSEPAKQVEPAKAEPKLGRDHKSFVACASDADCGWDHPCVPPRCVEPNAGRASCE